MITTRQLFCSRFAKARAARGLSQQTIAARLGVGQTTVSAWERGRHFPSPEMLDRLARVLRVHTSYLLF